MHEDEDLLTTAYHEAGHAVAYLVVGMEFSWVEIGRDKQENRMGSIRSDIFQRGATRSDDDLVCTLAGPMVEASYRDDDDYYGDVEGAAGDMEDAAQLAEHLSEDAYAHCVDRAWGLVTKHWDAIDRVAVALYRTRFLSYKDVASLFAREKLEFREAFARYAH